MDTTLASYLRGFHSYERSFNKRVIAADDEIHEAYKRAEESGELPFNRTKVLILGDHAAGKTSTCKRLQGKDFREDEPSTEGIDTGTVKAKVSDVNSKWCEVTNTPQEDYESSAAWLAVSRVLNRETDTTPRLDTPNVNRYVPMSSRRLVKDIFYQILQNSPIIIIFMFGGFNFGFGLVVWVNIICLMSIFDGHSAYRLGSGYTIAMVMLDRAMSITEYNELSDGGIDFWNDMSAVKLIFMFGIVSLIIGALIGSGGRTGMCIAFCLMVHPKQKQITIEHFTETINTRSYFKLIICIFAIITIIIFKYVYGNLLSKKRSTSLFLCLSITIFITSAAYSGTPYFLCILIYLSITVSVFCTCIGIIIGRQSVAYEYIPQIYIIKKSVGFIAGLIVAFVCGWELVNIRTLNLDDTYLTIPLYSVQLLFCVAPITGFIIYEWFAYMKVKNTSSNLMKHIRKSMEATVRNESYLDARFSLWDFAGQEMYYNTHHLFMPKQGVYLIVFNTVQAILNPEKQIKRLQFWLQSVAMHAEINNSVALLVGTRRQCIKDWDRLLEFTRLANKHLYKRFSNLLGFHTSGCILFLIENSMPVDQERNALREVIYNEIKKMNFFHKKFPIKYLLFNQTLKTFRLRKCIFTSVQDIEKEVQFTKSRNELCQILNYFDRAGDIIYNDSHELLRDYVICHPQMLVDILQCLVNVPEEDTRDRTVATSWQTLEDRGIVDRQLLEYLCRQKGIWDFYQYVICFLVGNNLLFPLNVTDQADQVDTFFLSARLPKISIISEIWTSDDDCSHSFYFDFGEILPECIFLRLVVKCCKVYKWEKIFYNAAVFRASKSCVFILKTEVITGSVFDRNMIMVAVQNADGTECMHVLQKMINFTEEIINRVFNPDYFRGKYMIGLQCERCSSLDGAMCLVNLTATGNDISTLGGSRPDHYHKFLVESKFGGFSCSRREDV